MAAQSCRRDCGAARHPCRARTSRPGSSPAVALVAVLELHLLPALLGRLLVYELVHVAGAAAAHRPRSAPGAPRSSRSACSLRSSSRLVTLAVPRRDRLLPQRRGQPRRAAAARWPTSSTARARRCRPGSPSTCPPTPTSSRRPRELAARARRRAADRRAGGRARLRAHPDRHDHRRAGRRCARRAPTRPLGAARRCAVGARAPARRRVPPHRVRPGAHLGAQHDAHRASTWAWCCRCSASTCRSSRR